MSKFVDVYLLPIKEERVSDYKKLAEDSMRSFMKYGARRYREYVAADLDVQDVVPFPAAVKLEPGETLIYAAVEFDSKADRDEAMSKLTQDPDMDPEKYKPLPFDPKRMVYGGFSILVDDQEAE